MLPRKFFDQNGAIWGAPKVCYYQPKNEQFEGKKTQQENLIARSLSPINLDEHVTTKINTFRIYKGVLGG